MAVISFGGGVRGLSDVNAGIGIGLILEPKYDAAVQGVARLHLLSALVMLDPAGLADHRK
jgi:hypothetical protein